MDQVEIQGLLFTIVTDYREGWNEEAFVKRYSDILNKYDYIVGDWGYGQLRLKGFYLEERSRVAPELKISYLITYLEEYCNFGCPYFVLKRK